MPFGVRNGAQTFQRFMNDILEDFNFVFTYIDDILISSCNADEHKKHIRQVLPKLCEHGISIQQEKGELGKSEIEFLGCVINKFGILPSNKLNCSYN